MMDYLILERGASPFLYRREPTMGDLAFFLWVLSPSFGKWCSEIGWRKKWLLPVQNFQAYLYGRKVRKILGFNIPASSEAAVIGCFEYVDKMFIDAPPAITKGGESCLCYLTAWFDAMRSEYHCSKEEVWKTTLPQLFQNLKAINQRRNPSAPSFNKHTDQLKYFILRGLRSKAFTMDDLKEGRINFDHVNN